MEKPRIRHIAINVQDREKAVEYYKKVFGMEVKFRASHGTVFLSDGFISLALISTTDLPWGINHFGFHVENVKTIEDTAGTTAMPNVPGAIGAELFIYDPEGNRIDLAEECWPF